MDSAARAGARGRVLLEAYNLTLPRGTGIATYARGLNSVIQELGYETEALVTAHRHMRKPDAQLGEITLFDGPRSLNLFFKAEMELRRAFGAPFGIKPWTVEGLKVVNRQPNALDTFRRIHAIPHMLEVERHHLLRHGRCLTVKLDDKIDLFHATRPAPLAVKGAANIYTVHDLVPLRLPNTTVDDKRFQLKMIQELARSADHIVTVSEYSRQDIIEFTGMDPARITNTYQSVEVPAHLRAKTESEVADTLERHFGLEPKSYFLFLGAIEPKKNLGRLIDAFAASGTKRPLIVSGGLGWQYEADMEKLNDERFLSYRIDGQEMRPIRQVRRLSYVPYEHVVALLRGARALLFPSIFEGFGLPVIEAMALGTPVMTSNITSLPEIAGGAAELVDPYDVEAMASAIRKLDADADLRSDLAARGWVRAEHFSRESYKQRMGNLYADVLGSRS